MRRIHETILPTAHCVIPPTNPTKPSAPASLSIRNTLDGGLHASFPEPTVRPMGTRYELIRSTNSADASVGTTVWDGTAQEVDFAAPNSGHWYSVRAYANSWYSAYTPNTFGVFGAARYPVTDLLRVIGDPEFEKSTAIGSYWITGYTNVWSLVPTGGVVGGLARLSLSSSDLLPYKLCGMPTTPYPRWDNGYQFTVVARMRRTAVFSWDTAIANTYTFRINAFCWTGVGSPNPQELGGGGNCRYFPNSTAYFPFHDVNSWAINEWRDYQVNLVATYSGSAVDYAHTNSYPYLCVGIFADAHRTRTGGLEVDLLGLQL